MDLKNLGELGFIREIKEQFSDAGNARIVRAVGDDTSVTRQSAGRLLLTTTDSLIEDVHFSLDWSTPEFVGRKSLQVSLSDIAAMGGAPLFYLVSLALPPETSSSFTDGLYNGLKSSQVEYNVALVGGNTTSAPVGGGIMVTTIVLGEVPADEVLYRDGANVGDIIFATGSLGSAALGLKILSGEINGDAFAGSAAACARQLDPAPRLAAGRKIAEEKIASSMMDISDGLIMDLKRLCEESGAGAEIDYESLPFFEGLKGGGPEREALALYGGEDYELLFTVPPEKRGKLEAIRDELGIAVATVGKIVEKERGVRVLSPDGKPIEFIKDGYEHFRS